ncbi:hypothetical protein MHI37_05470 [Paenibacillus sp. FSL H8-0548]|uniref:hypothetical protein n=1 Tax=Paenibacillus sp. FSL H8-0548 TaxID=1920422 RepID=UPI0015C3138D|nr:hypothetical protein [Paenibacillus sp. FSL H8-0548]
MLRTFSLDWCVLSAVVSAATQRKDSIVFWSVHPVIRYLILASRRAYDHTIVVNDYMVSLLPPLVPPLSM